MLKHFSNFALLHFLKVNSTRVYQGTEDTPPSKMDSRNFLYYKSFGRLNARVRIVGYQVCVSGSPGRARSAEGSLSVRLRLLCSLWQSCRISLTDTPSDLLSEPANITWLTWFLLQHHSLTGLRHNVHIIYFISYNTYKYYIFDLYYCNTAAHVIWGLAGLIWNVSFKYKFAHPSLLTWIWETRIGGHTLCCGLLGNKIEWAVFTGTNGPTQHCRWFTSLHIFISHMQPVKIHRPMQNNPWQYTIRSSMGWVTDKHNKRLEEMHF